MSPTWYDAVLYGDEQEVRRLLDSDQAISINAVVVDNLVHECLCSTALCIAAYRGHEGIVALLLERGADANTMGSEYGTALGVAAFKGHEKIVALLLDRGADVNTVGDTYETALGVAVYQGDEKIIALLLDRGADVNTVGGIYGPGTVLGIAVCHGHEGIVNLLLDRGANVNTMGGMYGTALGMAVSHGHDKVVALLLDRGADVNTVGGMYGTALGMAVSLGHDKVVALLLDRGADVNTVGGSYETALGVAAYWGNKGIVNLLLDRGADINTVGGTYGTALGVAVYEWHEKIVALLLDRGAEINTVGGKYGTPLGIALYQGNEGMVALLLGRGADAIHVGGNYETAQGGYPTALDAARSGKAAPGLLALAARVVEKETKRGICACTDGFEANLSHNYGVTTRPPFPLPYTQSYTGSSVDPSQPCAHAEAPLPAYGDLWGQPDTVFHAGDAITPEQANFPCQELNEEMLRRLLVALVGIDINKREEPRAKSLQRWIRNDIRYFVSQKFDFGLAYAAARVGWKRFNGTADDNSIAVQRAQWLKKAQELDEARTQAIYKHSSTGQELIQSPYSVMPRRIWDLKSNRVVEYRMLHAEMQSIDLHTQSPLYPTFWAVTHSWTDDMKPLVHTPINQYQWPIPLPENVDLEHDVRTELLSFGAEYVWVDVLCLRQHSGTQKPSDYSSSGALDPMKQGEWKIDVPTIGNIYRAAERIVRYFNGLGKPFSEHGWDGPRHWLRRAWTLQEISAESMTFNGGLGMSRDDSTRIILNTQGQVGGNTTTLRAAIRPILKLAASLSGRGGCSMYDLAREMARRCASQPTDKVAGLFYLLHTTQLPTYDELISDEEAWRKCFHVLPFQRKFEILCHFPYRGPKHWYPSWKQMMMWPERDDSYEHAAAEWSQDDGSIRDLELIPDPDASQVGDEGSLFVDKIWAISHVDLTTEASNPNEYEVKIGDKTFGFYFPYKFQGLIETENRHLTLAIPNPEHSYNWVVCEELLQNGKRKFEDIGGDENLNVLEGIVLRKVGVLRTDSCSELLVGQRGGGSILKRISCLFV